MNPSAPRSTDGDGLQAELARLRADHERQSLELSRVRAELDQLLDASIEMHVQAEAGRSAEMASRAKSEFLATISHEIRTPLHGILGNAELLLGTPLDDAQRRSVELLRSSAQALTVILNDVLDFSKIESGKLSLIHHPFDLGRCVRDAFALFQSVARDKGLTLHLQVPATLPQRVRGDAVRLRQVLLNLLSNAIKFTEAGGVTLHIEQDLASGATRFAVIDTGMGIPADRLGLLFHPFQQVDTSMSRRHGGTGLGLAISQHLVGLMGSRIRVRSHEGQGSTFEFEVLWERVDEEASGTSAEPTFDADFARRHPLSILVVEDNPVNQMVAMQMLARLGYQAELSGDGESAVQAQALRQYDLVLMDIQMPGIDGIEACRRIRALPAAHRPRVVALTANASEADRRAYLQAGMDSHLAKPFELKDLAAEIARAHDVLPMRTVSSIGF